MTPNIPATSSEPADDSLETVTVPPILPLFVVRCSECGYIHELSAKDPSTAVRHSSRGHRDHPRGELSACNNGGTDFLNAVLKTAEGSNS